MSNFIKVTEQESNYRHLEKMTIAEVLQNMNNEDKKVPLAVEKAIPKIEKLIALITGKMKDGGRLFYMGAGTSGRLGVLDASEIPPTYGIPHEFIVGLMAGGEEAIRKSMEGAEDSEEDGWNDLLKHNITNKDIVVGIAASGTTPYVIGALKQCRNMGISTGCIACNEGSPMANYADCAVEVVVGPEFVTGSTRMKSGTAQKLVLNMISTTVMIQLGRVEDNRMVNMQLNNNKLLDRGTKMLMEKGSISDYVKAQKLLIQYGTVKKAIEATKK